MFGALDDVLVGALGQRADADRRHVLRERLQADGLGELGTQLAHDLVGGLALAVGFERDRDAAAVHRRVEVARADEGHDRLDVGVLAHDVGDLALQLDHALEGHVLRSLGEDEQLARILARQEALGRAREQDAGRHADREERHERGALVREHAAQRRGVQVAPGVEAALEGHVQAAVAPVRVVRLEDAAAHHRREGERDEARDQHRDDDHHRELVQQPAEDAAHEEHRDEHRGERDGHRHDGERDLLRAVQRRLHHALAHLDVAADVLQHHDGVVHDEAHAQRQRHERDVVQAVAEHVHQREGADDGHRQRHARDDGRRNVAQEEEDHHHHQREREQQRELDLRD